ncbi:leptin receptor gene-related protein-like, partial [Glossina fuscipes]|uniref:Leptin receptor gene-related protein-like n=1 Tax=Glossina fuscipes TaxID=7396 RepID=A0A9C5Z8Z1_9MUSC
MTCIGMTFLILACAVPQPKIFYPFFVLIFYVISVIPMMLAKRLSPGSETNPKTEFALFLTSGMVLSSFALPIVLAHS